MYVYETIYLLTLPPHLIFNQRLRMHLFRLPYPSITFSCADCKLFSLRGPWSSSALLIRPRWKLYSLIDCEYFAHEVLVANWDASYLFYPSTLTVNIAADAGVCVARQRGVSDASDELSSVGLVRHSTPSTPGRRHLATTMWPETEEWRHVNPSSHGRQLSPTQRSRLQPINRAPAEF